MLWGDGRFALPAWFTSRFSGPLRPRPPVRLAGHGAGRQDPDHAAWPARGSAGGCPERAVLELLYEAGVKQSLEGARNLFDGLRSPARTCSDNCCPAAPA